MKVGTLVKLRRTSAMRYGTVYNNDANVNSYGVGIVIKRLGNFCYEHEIVKVRVLWSRKDHREEDCYVKNLEVINE